MISILNPLWVAVNSGGVNSGGVISNVTINKSNENWTIIDLDNYLINLISGNYKDCHFIFPNGVPPSYRSQNAINALIAEGTGNSLEIARPMLANTDEVIEWFADWVEANSIVETDIDMDVYDPCTNAALADIARFATIDNHNSFSNLEII